MHKRTSTLSAAARSRRPALSRSALALLTVLTACAADAAPYTYTGGGTGTAAAPITGNFSGGFTDGTNNNVSPPTNDYTTALYFGGSSTYTATNNLSTLNLNSLNFTNTGAVTLAASSFSLSLGGTAPAVNLNNTGSVTISQSLSLIADTTFSGTGSATVGGTIGGAGGLVMNGSGVLTISSGANSFTGATMVNRGVLSIAASGTLKQNTNVTINNSGTVRVDATNPFGTTTLSRTIKVNNGGLLTISNGFSSYLNNLVLSGGTLSSTSTPSTSGSWILSNSITAGGVAGTSIMSASNMALSQAAGTVFNVTTGATNGVDLDVTGNFFHSTATGVSDTGLIKLGNGVMRLTGANSYTGGTTINDGVLTVNTLTNGGSISSIGVSANTAANLVLNGGTLQYTGADTSTDRLFTLGASGGALDASGTGAIHFTNTGSLLIAANTGARTLSLTGTNTGINTLDAQINDATSSTISVVKNGTGTWILTNTNGYTGGRRSTAAYLGMSTDTNLGSSAGVINFNGGTLQTRASFTSIHPITLGVNGGTIDTNGNTSTFLGSIANAAGASGALTKTGTGTLTLSGANTYIGGTTVNGGTLNANASNALGTGGLAVNNANTGAGTVVLINFNASQSVTSLSSTVATASSGTNTAQVNIASGSTLTDTQSGTTNYAGSITGAGTLNIAGQGTGSGSGLVNYTGSDSAAQTYVGANATLQLNNSSGPALSGPVAVATGGTLTISPNGTNNEIATAAPPTASPTVAAVTLNGGTLNANGSDGALSTPTVTATTSVTKSMGALALGSGGAKLTPSLLNFGSGGTVNSPFVLAFADSSITLGTGYLNVTGYTGTTNALYIGTTQSLNAAQLNQIAFNGIYGLAGQLGNGQITLSPTPEPGGLVSLLLGAGGLAGLVFLRRRRTARAA